jgi:DNA-binding transcriptional MerR regulator
MPYTITQFSKKTGLPSPTLRYYESEGILPFVRRNASGYRSYDDVNAMWIDFILALRETGMPLTTIKRYVDLYKEGSATMAERKAILLSHQEKVREELQQIQQHLAKIDYKLGLYEQLEADPTRTDIAI